MKDKPIILASQSPRRADLLREAGVAFVVDVPDVDERAAAAGLSEPRSLTLAVARAKCAAVALRHPNDTVLASDTVVSLDGEILEKPRDAADAARMLRKLSGRVHTVCTAVVAASPRGVFTTADTAAVTFRELTDGEIAAYVATGEPLDKAGAYGIQGFGAALVAHLDGDITTVVGLPLKPALQLLQKTRI